MTESYGDHLSASIDKTSYRDLPSGGQSIYGDETTYHQLVGSFVGFLREEQTQSGDYSSSLEATFPETEQFSQEIVEPYFQTVETILTQEGENFRFACYSLNRDKKGIPLVVKLGFAQGAESRIGRPFLQALCNKVDQLIIVIDSVGIGKTSIHLLGGASHAYAN